MQLKHRPKGSRLASLPMVAWNAYLLTDDFVHSRIEEAAEKLQKKSGMERKTLAYCSFIAGSASSAAVLWSSPVHSALVAAFSAMALLPLRNLIEKASEFRASSGAVAEDEVRHAASLLFRTVRLPALLGAAWKLAEGFASHDIHSLSTGLHFAGTGIAAYLVTSGTGMLDKARKFIAGMGERLAGALAPEPHPVPVPIPNR